MHTKAAKSAKFGYYDLEENVPDFHRIEDMEVEGRVIMLRVQSFDNQIHLFLLISRDSQLIYVRRKLNRDMTPQSYPSEVPMQNIAYFRVRKRICVNEVNESVFKNRRFLSV